VTGHECAYALGDTPQNRHIGVRGTAQDDRGVASVEVAVLKGCAQMTHAGAFAALTDCARPTTLLEAHGTRAWTVT
jgi:hypothetical protein